MKAGKPKKDPTTLAAAEKAESAPGHKKLAAVAAKSATKSSKKSESKSQAAPVSRKKASTVTKAAPNEVVAEPVITKVASPKKALVKRDVSKAKVVSRAKKQSAAPEEVAETAKLTDAIAPVLTPVLKTAAREQIQRFEAVEPPVISSRPDARAETEPTPEVKIRYIRKPRSVPVAIPPILLEPDYLPNEPAITGPEVRFAPPTIAPATESTQPKDLPESYGTQQIFLTARDPYCLFVSWDLDSKQRANYNSASASGALVIRLRRGSADGPVHLEVHTLPESRDWFIEGAQPDTTFVAELGYHEKNSGNWRGISTSKPATTPRDRVAPMPAPSAVDRPQQQNETPERREPPVVRDYLRAASLPQRDEIFFATQAPSPEPHWIVGDRSAPPQASRGSEAPRPAPVPKWTPAQAKALDELISLEFRRMQKGSLEIEELLRRRILRGEEEAAAVGPSSIELQGLRPEELVARALGLAQPAPSSQEAAPAPEARKGFWFRVNAELIIYGSTEPDAHVSIGGRPIRLRPDGSFSYRFALPDGAYELPVIALSKDGDDGRVAELRFSRASRYMGDVPPHAQDPALKTPSVANL